MQFGFRDLEQEAELQMPFSQLDRYRKDIWLRHVDRKDESDWISAFRYMTVEEVGQEVEKPGKVYIGWRNEKNAVKKGRCARSWCVKEQHYGKLSIQHGR